MKEKIETKNENLDTENQIEFIGDFLKEFLYWEDLKEEQPTLHLVLLNLPKEKLDKISTKFKKFEEEYYEVMRPFEEGGLLSDVDLGDGFCDQISHIKEDKIVNILNQFIVGDFIPYYN